MIIPAFIMKKIILESIYKAFDSWALQFSPACRKGCSTCCSQDVMVTAVEAETVLDHISENHMEKWLAAKLDCDLPRIIPAFTTNENAQACLNGTELIPEPGSNGGVCPFLENGACSIYRARPFSCRSFASTMICRPGTNAAIPQHYMTAVTAVSQVIEHLDQRNLWGNMLHVMYLLAQQNSKTEDPGYPENKKRLVCAQTSCRSSKPLPGFLIPEEDFPHLEPLIREIFDTKIGSRRIEDILNNRQ